MWTVVLLLPYIQKLGLLMPDFPTFSRAISNTNLTKILTQCCSHLLKPYQLNYEQIFEGSENLPKNAGTERVNIT